MSFNIALTGLNAVSQQLNSISNNIANSGTVGFKSSRTEFGSLYSGTQAMGVGVLGQTQSMGLGGSHFATGNNLNLAISESGFFVTRSSSGDINYTRAGAFGKDRDNYLVDASGQFLQGYPVDAAGNLQVGVVGEGSLQGVEGQGQLGCGGGKSTAAFFFGLDFGPDGCGLRVQLAGVGYVFGGQDDAGRSQEGGGEPDRHADSVQCLRVAFGG